MPRPSYLVSETVVRPYVVDLLNAASQVSVRTLREACFNGGRIDGKHHDSCIRATLAKAYGYEFRDLTRDQVRERLASFCSDIGVLFPFEEKLDVIDEFFFDVCFSQNFEKNPALAQLLVWCDEALDRKNDIELDDVHENAGEAVYAEAATD